MEEVHHLRKPESQKHHRDVLAQVLTSTPVFIDMFQQKDVSKEHVQTNLLRTYSQIS
jgi:hypothetical protein